MNGKAGPEDGEAGENCYRRERTDDADGRRDASACCRCHDAGDEASAKPTTARRRCRKRRRLDQRWTHADLQSAGSVSAGAAQFRGICSGLWRNEVARAQTGRCGTSAAQRKVERAWEAGAKRRPSVRVGRRPLMEANRGRRWSPRWEFAWRLLLGKRPDKASEVVRQGLWAGGLLRGALHVSSPPTTQQPCGRAAGFTRIIFHHVNTIIYPIFTHSDATVRRARGAPHLPSTRLACCQPPQVPLRPPQFEGQIFSRTVLVSLPFLSFLAVTSSLRSHARFDASPSFLRSGACSVCAAPRTGLVLLPGSVCSPFAHVAPSFITNAFPVSHRASYIVAFRR